MKVALLKKVKEHILAHPKRFLMGSFIEARKISGEDTFFDDGGQEIKFDHCGTAACIAGWTCLLKMKEKAITLGGSSFHNNGKDYLGLTNDEAHRLFYTDEWPPQFANNYEIAKDPKAWSRIAAARIDHFIATKGKE